MKEVSLTRPGQRAIPARAGERLIWNNRNPHPVVYPRACGGTLGCDSYEEVDNGLSPRVRGNLVSALETQMAQRSIPARAGEPRFWPISRWLIKVYPRVYGGTMGGGPAPASDFVR